MRAAENSFGAFAGLRAYFGCFAGRSIRSFLDPSRKALPSDARGALGAFIFGRLMLVQCCVCRPFCGALHSQVDMQSTGTISCRKVKPVRPGFLAHFLTGLSRCWYPIEHGLGFTASLLGLDIG